MKRDKPINILNTVKLRANSNLKRSAQTDIKCALGGGQYEKFLQTGIDFVSNSKNCIIDRIVIMLLYTYGLRISEVLSIRFNDISETGTILIHPKKGSEVRLVSGHIFTDWILKHKGLLNSGLENRNRWYYYRLFKKLGITKKMVGNENYATTHVFRYMFVAEIKKRSGDSLTTQKIVGHKSQKSTVLYENKIKKS